MTLLLVPACISIVTVMPDELWLDMAILIFLETLVHP